MAFHGRESVFADLRLHQQAGGVRAATLNRLGTTAVAYSYVRLWPARNISALGRGGSANTETELCAWRVGESDAPTADDSWTVGGTTYLIVSVRKRLDADESDGYCIYDCDLTTSP